MVKTITSAGKEVFPPVLITTASFAGIGFQSWVYILTGAYTLLQIFRLVPKIIGCGRCFYRNGTCKLECKSGNAMQEKADV